jgi:hypothetical protein
LRKTVHILKWKFQDVTRLQNVVGRARVLRDPRDGRHARV